MPNVDHGKIKSYLACARIWAAIAVLGAYMMAFSTVKRWYLTGLILTIAFSSLMFLTLIVAAYNWRRQERLAVSAPIPEPLGYWDYKVETPKALLSITELGALIVGDFNTFTARTPYHQDRIATAGGNPFLKRRRLAQAARDWARMAKTMDLKVTQLEADTKIAAEGYVVIADWEQPNTPLEIAEARSYIHSATKFLEAVRASLTGLDEFRATAIRIKNIRGENRGLSQAMNQALALNISTMDRAIAALRNLEPALEQAIETWRLKVNDGAL